MPIDKKPQCSFRLNYDENTRITEIEKRFPSENIKDLLFSLIDYAMKPTESNITVDVSEYENIIESGKNLNHELRADLVELQASHDVLQHENVALQNSIETLKAIETKCLNHEYTIETIEKEFVIHPNSEQIHRLELARKELTKKHKIEFPTTSHLLDQLVDVAMDRLGYKYAELK